MTKNLSAKITENANIIETAVKKYIPTDDLPYGMLIESMLYSASAGGKRIRPFLTLEASRMLSGNDASALPYAVAIEMIHTYSLIHDDLPCMDNDDIRRGKPTNHVKFGEATALLAGDALLTHAFSVAASNENASPEQNLKAIRLLSDNAGYNGMIGGQMLDLLGEKIRPSIDDFLLMNRLKTGCLIRTACLLGAVSAGYFEDTPEYTAIEKYSESIGLAFQIEDDILDIGTEDQKTTFLSFMTVDKAKNKIRELTDSAKNIISKIDGSSVLCDFAEFLASRTV